MIHEPTMSLITGAISLSGVGVGSVAFDANVPLTYLVVVPMAAAAVILVSSILSYLDYKKELQAET